MRAEVSVAVDPQLSVAEGHRIAKEVEHELRHELSFLSSASVHVDPLTEVGEAHHLHAHD
jgi:divalent metal cation (Fe/Co/Zn/Cd) transporter